MYIYTDKNVIGKKLEVPVLFLHAKYDLVLETVDDPLLMEDMRNDCPDSTEVVVESAHWMAPRETC